MSVLQVCNLVVINEFVDSICINARTRFEKYAKGECEWVTGPVKDSISRTTI